MAAVMLVGGGGNAGDDYRCMSWWRAMVVVCKKQLRGCV